eukprot:TRINITY_DN3672_c0_g2_i1.p1 TRINITY_DN3672_c0_g2~~TRINITY_DN3672_c0_g2_i1.p1  ORF type:complete len:471 (+),score=106.27 TRINITY_DN3672_c0_g2_i1:81-1493(+)
MDPEEYKRAKEAFVSGLPGTTLSEVSFITLVCPISFFFHHVVSSFLSGSAPHLHQSTIAQFLVHFVCLELPLLISFTLTEYTLPMILLQVFVALGLIFSSRQPIFQFANDVGVRSVNGEYRDQLKPFLSAYRALMMISTCIAILAVDFQVFPRRFAKTENYGFSLMDAGVGSFIVSHALVSPQARAVSTRVEDKDKARPKDQDGMFALLRRVFWSVSPMLLLGSTRFFLVKAVNYQEHTSEYGAHWNFFFTLGVVALGAALIRLPAPSSALLGVLFVLGYQFSLSVLGLTDYIMTAPRVDFASANKEGICSSVGYLGLYLISTAMGHYLHRPATGDQWKAKLKLLTVVDVVLFAATLFSHLYIQPCSRRMMNLSYVLWMLALNLQSLLLFLLINLSMTRPNNGFIVQAVNKNQLAVFLGGNLSTGLVNLSFYTIYMGTSVSMFILTVYLLFVCVLASLLYVYKINTKFWA